MTHSKRPEGAALSRKTPTEVLVLPHGEGVVMGEMDPERLKSVRHNLQALKHLRLNTTVTEMPVNKATKT